MALFGLLPDAPKAPDPKKTAQAQQQYNQDAFNASSIDRSNPFGSSTFNRDANGNVTGMTNALSGALQGGADAGANAASSQFGLLPTTGINWDTTTAPQIAQQNYDAYAAMTAPSRQQQQSELNVRMGERGLPIGSEISDNQWGNLNRDFALADTNAAAQAWNAVPGMQGQMINNQIGMYDQAANSATKTTNALGLLGGLAPQAQQPGQQQAVDYSGLVNNQYNAQMDSYNNEMAGYGALAGAGLGLLTAPMTGGTSLLGMGAGGLFNTPKTAQSQNSSIAG
jgi:hypothetical protein